jgi:hypothetical protein
VNDLARAVARMLAAFGATSADRAELYVEALRAERLCELCGAAAAERLMREAVRRPVPAQLIDATRAQLGTAAHQHHVTASALPQGERTWWQTEAPRVVLRLWPELDAATAQAIADRLSTQEGVRADAGDIAVALGWADEHGPTPERQWWHRVWAPARGVTLPGGDARS